MNILLHYDVIVKYLEKKDTFTKSQIDLNRDNLFNDPFNQIILSNKFIDLIDEQLTNSNINILGYYQSMIVELSDNHRIINLQSNIISNIEDEFSNLYNNATGRIFFTFVESPNPVFNNFQYNLCIIDNISIPNKDWILLELCAKKYFIVHFYHFADDSQINIFFNDIFSIHHNLQIINIVDDYMNFNSHNNFNFIRNNNIKINYFSTGMDPATRCPRQPYTQQKLQGNKSNIKNYFSQDSEYFVSNNRAYTHPRRILFENIILSPDIDFAQIKFANRNWFISVEYSQLTYRYIMNCLNTFTKI